MVTHSVYGAVRVALRHEANLSPALAPSGAFVPEWRFASRVSASEKAALYGKGRMPKKMPQAHNIPVLMFHHVTAEGGFLSVSAQQFENQMKALAEGGYSSVGADDFAAFLHGRPLPKKSVLLTFDDGYLDNWVYAHPILKRYGMTAMLFAITGLIGEGAPRPHSDQSGALPLCPAHRQAKEQMFGEDRDKVMLRWSEVHQMLHCKTFEVHSHTHTHTRWDLSCDSPEEKIERINEDLYASRRTLLEQVGAVSSHLCWPQGYFDADYKRAAQQYGFKYLYTTDARGQNTQGSDASHIYRIAAKNRSGLWMRRRIWLATHPVWGPAYNNWKLRSASVSRP